MEQESILKKIKALMDKAASARNGSGTIAEAESFMTKAQELLLKYNLDTEKVSSYEDVRKEGVEEEKVAYEEDWEINLLSGICRNNFCEIVIHFGAQKISCIGKPSNVNVCLYLFSFFRNAILEPSIAAYSEFLDLINEDGSVKLPKNNRINYIKSYLNGAVDGVISKMSSQLQIAKSENSNIAGLMVVTGREIEIYMNRHYPSLGSYRSGTKTVNSNGYGRGHSDGSGLSANNGISYGQKRIG